MKKFLLIFINLIGIIFYTHALIISEIMYDPQGSDSGREWIEVYNETANSVDLSSWKFFESGTNHNLSINQGSAILPGNSYAVIADNPTKFLTDYPNFSGVLFDSSFSLLNSGEHLAMKETSSGAEISFVDYDISLGGSDDGSTLSFISSLWKRGEATPAVENKESVLEITATSTTTTENQVSLSQMSPPTSDIVFYLPFEKIIVAGAETEFSTSATTKSGKKIEGLVYEWAFGDGGRSIGTSTKYIYAYPGKYIAQVEGVNGFVAGTGRINVKVIAPDIFIEKIDKGKYGTFIDIKNPNNYDLDLSQWKLSIDEKIFPFPKNTLIAKNSVTHFSGRAMGFASADISTSTTIKILFPTMEEVTRYVAGPGVLNKISTSTISTNVIPVSSSRIQKSSTAFTTFTPTTKKQIATTSSSTIKIVTNKTENKNTGIANWLKKLFGF